MGEENNFQVPQKECSTDGTFSQHHSNLAENANKVWTEERPL